MLSVLILLRLKLVYAILSLLIFFILFFFTEDTVDIIHYTKLARVKYGSDILYNYIIYIIGLFIENNKTIILVYQLFFLSFASLIIFFFKENKILILSIIFSSVGVLLTVHNNLRQGTSCIFILIGIIAYIHNKKKIGILSFLVSLGFHKSAVLLIPLICTLGFIYKYFIHNNYLGNLRTINSYFISLFLAIICAYIILNFQEIIMTYSKYLGQDLASKNSLRVNHETKMIILLLYWISTEYFMKFRAFDYKIDFFRFLRSFFIFLPVILSLSQNGFEIANRIIFIYYIIEIGLLCLLIDRKLFKLSVYILFVYGFAFNVWQLID